ncbi:uncharacterized protein LOC135808665 [Sycon ciliatum]|uniref:uncharacterized protein LOC135808665 n=1 Tax=Sycon ciliatum TaxID=27933 RepID=UPI0031F5F40B
MTKFSHHYVLNDQIQSFSHLLASTCTTDSQQPVKCTRRYSTMAESRRSAVWALFDPNGAAGTNPNNLVLLSLMLRDQHGIAAWPEPAPGKSAGMSAAEIYAAQIHAAQYAHHCRLARSSVEGSGHVVCFFSEAQTMQMVVEAPEAHLARARSPDKVKVGGMGGVLELGQWLQQRAQSPPSMSAWYYTVAVLSDALSRYPLHGVLARSRSKLTLHCVFDVGKQLFEEKAISKLLKTCMAQIFPQQAPDKRQPSNGRQVTSFSTGVGVNGITLDEFNSSFEAILYSAVVTDDHWVHSMAGIIPCSLKLSAACDTTERMKMEPPLQHPQLFSPSLQPSGEAAKAPCLSNIFPGYQIEGLERLLGTWNGSVRIYTCIGSADALPWQFLNTLGCLAYGSMDWQGESDADAHCKVCHRISRDGQELLVFLSIDPTCAPATSTSRKLASTVIAALAISDSTVLIESNVNQHPNGKRPLSVVQSLPKHLSTLTSTVTLPPSFSRDRQLFKGNVILVCNSSSSPTNGGTQGPTAVYGTTAKSLLVDGGEDYVQRQSQQYLSFASLTAAMPISQALSALSAPHDNRPSNNVWMNSSRVRDLLKLILLADTEATGHPHLLLDKSLMDQIASVLGDLERYMLAHWRLLFASLETARIHEGCQAPPLSQPQDLDNVLEADLRCFARSILHSPDVRTLRDYQDRIKRTYAENVQQLCQDAGKVADRWMYDSQDHFSNLLKIKLSRRLEQLKQRSMLCFSKCRCGCDLPCLLASGHDGKCSALVADAAGQDGMDSRHLCSHKCMFCQTAHVTSTVYTDSTTTSAACSTSTGCSITTTATTSSSSSSSAAIDSCSSSTSSNASDTSHDRSSFDESNTCCTGLAGHHLLDLDTEDLLHLCSEAEAKHRCGQAAEQCWLLESRGCAGECKYWLGHASRRSDLGKCMCNVDEQKHLCPVQCEMQDHRGCGAVCSETHLPAHSQHLCTAPHQCADVCEGVECGCFDSVYADHAGNESGRSSARSISSSSSSSISQGLHLDTRKPCMEWLRPGERHHAHPHSCHGPTVYCKKPCPSACGRVCWLRLGHSQPCEIQHTGYLCSASAGTQKLMRSFFQAGSNSGLV